VTLIRSFSRHALAISALSWTVCVAAAAQESSADTDTEERIIATGVSTTADGSVVTYDSVYFEAYQSVTAADMLRWVPGGAELLPDTSPRARDANSKRGFGSGGDQILINGRRVSGKSNDIQAAMQRIQAGSVERIEVIRGTASGLDVRSKGTIINVVLSEALSGGAGSWRLHSGFYGGPPKPDGLISYNDSAGILNYQAAFEYGPYNRGTDVDLVEEYFAPDSGALLEHRDIHRPEMREEFILATSGNWSFLDGDVLNLNARLADNEKEEIETTEVFVTGNPDVETLLNESIVDSVQWEVGGDLDNRIGPDGLLKTRVIYSSKSSDEVENVSLGTTVPGNVPSQSMVLTDELATETILRSSYTWPVASGQSLELGLEGAINTLEKDVQLFEVLPDGTLNPIDVFNADSDVDENRYEFFSTHFWQTRENLVLESALNVEYSKISQSGIDVENSRTFTYVKPRFDLRWDLTNATQLRASFERTVSQLDFSDFVATFDNDDDQVDAGNPDLEPEKAWEAKLTYETRLSDDSGNIELQLFYNDIEDHIDKIAATNNISSPGNIGDAKNYGATIKGSFRLGRLNLEGAVIDASYTWQDSEATDPFTGEQRVMVNKPANRYSVRFRHDISAWKLNYTVDVQWNDVHYATDINFKERTEPQNARTNITIQYQLTDRLLLWFDTRVVFDWQNQRYRERYVGNIADGNLLRNEVREQTFRREHIVGLRGQF
jgi:outer membrane receptor for ferrienterochelin and colicins